MKDSKGAGAEVGGLPEGSLYASESRQPEVYCGCDLCLMVLRVWKGWPVPKPPLETETGLNQPHRATLLTVAAHPGPLRLCAQGPGTALAYQEGPPTHRPGLRSSRPECRCLASHREGAPSPEGPRERSGPSSLEDKTPRQSAPSQQWSAGPREVHKGPTGAMSTSGPQLSLFLPGLEM